VTAIVLLIVCVKATAIIFTMNVSTTNVKILHRALLWDKAANDKSILAGNLTRTMKWYEMAYLQTL
jgi:hypothetical protein